MSIIRIIANPADVGAGGYGWHTNVTPITASSAKVFDPERVSGAFFLTDSSSVLSTVLPPPAGTEFWVHFRFLQKSSNSSTYGLVNIQDINGVTLGRIEVVYGRLNVKVYGDTTAETNGQTLTEYSLYSLDAQVVADGTNITMRFYINGAFYGEATAPSTNTMTNGVQVDFSGGYAGCDYWYSEIIFADEDTRGMRLRELRPRSFGIFQEWDGAVANLTDFDLATGISTDTSGKRVSFGVGNIENIKSSDVINRVVAQTYAQKGENGVPNFNHFFRFRDGTVTDGADIAIADTGSFLLEEYVTNPNTGVNWAPEDFKSIQTGLRSRP